MALLLLAATLTAYELLWVTTEKTQAALHAQYDRVDETDHGLGMPGSEVHADHLLIADLDGDKHDDFIVVLVPKERDAFAVYAFLSRPRSTEMAVPVIRRAPGKAEYVQLAAQRRGTAGLSLVVTPKGSAPRAFVWAGPSGTFREVPP